MVPSSAAVLVFWKVEKLENELAGNLAAVLVLLSVYQKVDGKDE